tara:strand:+ start:3513 stop:4460 length:948 start_codon:yes stop_codon:yes gene_type:complete
VKDLAVSPEIKRVMVTGGSGQIGSAIKLLKKNTKYQLLFPSSNEFDITKSRKMSNYLDKKNIDMIINLAAYTNVDQAEKAKRRSNEVNNKGVYLLASKAIKRNIELIHFSTDYVFGKGKNKVRDMNDKKSPINFYGLTKSLGEDYILQNDYNYLVIRVASVFGLCGNNFVKTIMKLLLEREEVRVIKDQKISMTSSFDVAKNIYKIINLYNRNSVQKERKKIIHLTNKGYTNWYSVAKIVKDEMEKNLKSEINSKIIPIKSNEWLAKATRPKDSRLKVDFKYLESANIHLPYWEQSVRYIVKNILKNESIGFAKR